MGIESEETVQLYESFLKKNYNYLWLKTMLEKGKKFIDHGNATLITGSSHALNGIKETIWENALNCSMHSQDLYYDFLCAKTVVKGRNRFKRCFILFGYYIAYQDLSLSKEMRDYMVSPVYYPIFGDAHNWTMPVAVDIWKDFKEISVETRAECEKWSQQKICEESTYYSNFKHRKPFFDFQGHHWRELSVEDQDRYAKQRAEGHNSILKYTNSFYENQQILCDYVHFLHLNDVKPIVVISPFSSAYNRYIDERLKIAVNEMIEKVPEAVCFVDFNKALVFGDADFIDMDHLNEQGAEKMSQILVEQFGK